MNPSVKPSWKRATRVSPVTDSYAFTAEHGVTALGGSNVANQLAVANLMRGFDPDLYLFAGGSFPTAERANLDANWNVWNQELLGSRVVSGFGINELVNGTLSFPLTNPNAYQYHVAAASVGNVDTGLLVPGFVLDGYTTQDGDYVLLKNQTMAQERGIWVVGNPSYMLDGFYEKRFNLVTVLNGSQNGVASISDVWYTNPQDGPFVWVPLQYDQTKANFPGADSFNKFQFIPSLRRYFSVKRDRVTFWFIDAGVNPTGFNVEGGGNFIGSPQYEWLASGIANSQTTWNVVVVGSPGFSSSSDQSRVIPALAWDWDQINKSNGRCVVDLVLTGGPSVYERSFVGDVPVVTCGIGGNALGTFGAVNPQSVFRYNSAFGALRLDVSDRELNLIGESVFSPFSPKPFDLLRLEKRFANVRARWTTK